MSENSDMARPDVDPDASVCESSLSGSARLTDDRGDVTVEVGADSDCATTYRISSTAQRRDGQPSSPRVVREQEDWPRLRSGSALVDGLYAMALEETRQNSVDEISDGSFNGGQPLACPPGGCFETGALWHYVWTRDISYALDLGLAELDPVRARNSLMFKLSERRGGGGTQIMQDTGTGGSYPVSTDRVVWALGARAVIAQLPADEANEFAGEALDALLNTLAHDRVVVFDQSTGLYFGEQSFLDWREQSYPAWVEPDPMHIATSRSLSTNLLHLRAMDVAVELAGLLGRDAEAAPWSDAAMSLRQSIVERLWLDDRGQFSSFLVTYLDTAGSPQLDLLGSSLAVLQDVTSSARASQLVAGYPHVGVGAPVIFPQQQFTPIYHNRAEWPFVSAYWLRAAGRADNAAVAERMVDTLMRGAALNLSNMENWEAVSGAPWVDDGEFSGPVVNSQRQLWSVAGFVSMVHQSIFGLQPDLDPDPVLRVAPRLTTATRAAYFADASTITLHDYRYRGMSVTVVIELPETPGDGFYSVAEVRLDGEIVTGPIPASAISDGAEISVTLGAPTASSTEITLVSADDWRDVFAPQPPRIDSVADDGGKLRLDFSTADTEPVTWTVYRDGERVASEVTSATWLDPDSDSAATSSPCYVVESCFPSSGNCSQHSQPVCWWGAAADRIVTVAATAMQNTGGVLSDEHGRSHWSVWGDPGHRLVVAGLVPAQSGSQLVQIGYGNGAGPTSTGITCGVKRLVVVDETDESVVADSIVVMPQLGSWDIWGLSSFAPVEMDAGRTYRIELSSDETSAVNMSAFEHFSAYSGEGGAAEFNRVNIAELRVLSR